MTGRGTAHQLGLTGAVVLTLTMVGTVPACGGDVPVAPLPVHPPTTAATSGPPVRPTQATPSATTAPPTARPSVAAPPTRPPAPTTPAVPPAPTATPSPTALPDACLGAVRYDLVLAETELALLTSLCFATGGVLRIIGIGPGEVTVEPAELVSHDYEAGVVDLRFVRPGTVAVRIPQGGVTHTVTVVAR
ncbi:hypothetical protein O7606_08690 [Micromonospora sp. WMMD882]|uniref:hypothetical protein n=1 Tax=Micromonospora sp. WMMD882 TaxID=3015151 RepID=UPI00248C1EC1|nr:hypothetical protein [Micromonospora sp. WMMD882]WBB81421.1 hypothetical protein O7606_08690 [Micromonospora sp. WMMD882]